VLAFAADDSYSVEANQTLTGGTWSNNTYNASWTHTYYEDEYQWIEDSWQNPVLQSGYWEYPVWYWYDENDESLGGYYIPTEPVCHDCVWVPPEPVLTPAHWEGAWVTTTHYASGSFSSPANGSLSSDGNGNFTYTPNHGFVGTDGFSYSLTDNAGTGTATVTISVFAPPPLVANDDYFSVAADGVLSGGVLGNDSGSSLTASAGGTSFGSLVFNSNGSFTYTPTAGTSAPADAFSYTIVNAGGSSTATAHITIFQPPVANNDNYVIEPGLTLNASVLANDSDPNGDSLLATLLTLPTFGTFCFNADGSSSYTPNAGFHGTDAFSYTASDGSLTSTATVTIVVNAAPIAPTDSYRVYKNMQLTVRAADGVLRNDYDINGDPLTVSLVNGTTHGTVHLNYDGSFRYDPDNNASSAEFVGEFWGGKFAEGVKEGELNAWFGAKAVGLSHGQFHFVVETLHDAR
jgi:Bacterial Ig domain/Bacterial cadherin-like domain